jgi:hypothetical protein
MRDGCWFLSGVKRKKIGGQILRADKVIFDQGIGLMIKFG